MVLVLGLALVCVVGLGAVVVGVVMLVQSHNRRQNEVVVQLCPSCGQEYGHIRNKPVSQCPSCNASLGQQSG